MNIEQEKSRLLALAADWFNVGFSDRQAPEVFECILDFAVLVRAMDADKTVLVNTYNALHEEAGQEVEKLRARIAELESRQERGKKLRDAGFLPRPSLPSDE